MRVIFSRMQKLHETGIRGYAVEKRLICALVGRQGLNKLDECT